MIDPRYPRQAFAEHWTGSGLVIDLPDGTNAITGVEPGIAYTSGSIWIDREQLDAALARGWREGSLTVWLRPDLVCVER